MKRAATVILAILLGLVVSTGDIKNTQATPDFVDGEMLVKFRPSISRQGKDNVHKQNGGKVKRTIPGIEVDVVEVTSGKEKDRLVKYQRNPNVAFAEINGYYSVIDHGTSDPRSGQQWQYDNTGQTGGTVDADIDAYEAWHVTQGSDTVSIAILDTGIDQDHPDLASKITLNHNFTTSSTVNDLYGHGTHVAGSAVAVTDNAAGVAGTCPNCVLHNGKVLDDDGRGSWSSIADGIAWAADNGAKVINMSLGGSTGSSTVEQAINYASGKGVVVVAAAGNNGNSTPSYPAYYVNVIAVASTNHQDQKSSFSNYGNWVDVAAPGQSILSTAPNHPSTKWPNIDSNNPYGTLNGTSMAAPHAAGVAGLIWSSGKCSTADCVRAELENNADQIAGTGSHWSKGRINAYKSVQIPNTPPSVSIMDPTNGQSIAGIYRIKVTASDVDGTLTKLELSVDDTPFSEITLSYDGASYYLDWNTILVADGAHKLMARATDNYGVVSTSAAISVNIDNVDEPPSVNIVSPVNGSTVKGSILLQASASDDRGLENVAYAIDGGTYVSMTKNASTGYYEAVWNTTAYANGSSHTIDARSTDLGGQQAQATQVTVMVNNYSSPKLIAAVSTNKDAYTRGETVQMSVYVTENTGVPVPSASVQIQLRDAKGILRSSSSKTTNGSGSTSFSWTSKKSSTKGTYNIMVTASKTGYDRGDGNDTFVLK